MKKNSLSGSDYNLFLANCEYLEKVENRPLKASEKTLIKDKIRMINEHLERKNNNEVVFDNKQADIQLFNSLEKKLKHRLKFLNNLLKEISIDFNDFCSCENKFNFENETNLIKFNTVSKLLGIVIKKLKGLNYGNK